MHLPVKNRVPGRLLSTRGLSLIEMLVSVVIIMTLMAAVFPFIAQVQKRFQGNQVVSESNQSARAALEVMSQEIGQAGFNPNYYPNKTSSANIIPNAKAQCVSISSVSQINPGDWVSVDTGVNNELVQVVGTSSANGGATPCPALSPVPPYAYPPAAPYIKGVFQSCHNYNSSGCPATTTLGPFAVSSYKMPFGGGLLYSVDGLRSNAQRLEFYGDINQDGTGTISYVIYSISPTVPATTVCIPQLAPGVACPAATTYTLYNLYRSITTVPFYNLPPTPSCIAAVAPFTSCSTANNIASPMVEKVLFNTTTNQGPTGLPIFGYPSQVVVGVVPNQVTVVGTLVITLCVAVNPRSLETNRVSWYTMATQIRPLNLTAAVNVNNSGGGKLLPLNPASLPMTIPAGYYP
jgi:type II secretory pathway pseudopilin PulG